jgi:hypothetical protein
MIASFFFWQAAGSELKIYIVLDLDLETTNTDFVGRHT